MVSLLPSTAVTLPLPNFWWKTRSPTVKAETVPVDFATSSPSMVSGARRPCAGLAAFGDVAATRRLSSSIVVVA